MESSLSIVAKAIYYSIDEDIYNIDHFYDKLHGRVYETFKERYQYTMKPHFVEGLHKCLGAEISSDTLSLLGGFFDSDDIFEVISDNIDDCVIVLEIALSQGMTTMEVMEALEECRWE